MGKTYVRVDDRLIHGQIVVAWAQTLSIQEIIAIDDQTAQNKMLQKIMLMGVSLTYHPKIMSYDDAKTYLSTTSDMNRLVIVRKPEYLPDIIPYIENIEMIYLGNIQKTSESKHNLASGGGGILFLSDQDVVICDQLISEGHKIVLQTVPTSNLKTWEQAKKAFK